ncbi:hypothetical protein C2E23DRAFT_885059 [Lenzites betulinus]|nr:hypothetical protein C2E23DRAFT_885059 [Lenzites betulinus]
MSILPSPPHISLSPEPAFPHYRHPDYTMKSVLAASWRVLEQPPPPTLREILEAYKARGDGDREMLLAMLNAKSSEDQRLASLATLHRAMLDMYQSAPPAPPVLPLHVPEPPSHHHYAHAHAHHFPSPPASYHHSPHAHIPQQLHHDPARRRTDSVSSSLTESRERIARSPSTSAEQPRKRRRTSRSPPPRLYASPSHDGALPPSPYSSSSTQSGASGGGGGSPRSRESMAINSLLLDAHAERADEAARRHTSAERSTTSSGARDR